MKQQYIVCSEQERGFWADKQGWVFDVANATRYTNRGRLWQTLPSIGVPDCRIIMLQNARDYSSD